MTTTETLEMAERRNFLKLAGSGAFTAAIVAGAAGSLWSTAAVAQTAQEEADREAAAEHTMTIATAYILGWTLQAHVSSICIVSSRTVMP